MKRFGNLFTQLCSIENIEYAHNRAKRGKAHYTEVIMVENEPEKYFNIIHEHTLVRKSIVSNFKQRRNQNNITSYNGWFIWADTFNLRRKYDCI